MLLLLLLLPLLLLLLLRLLLLLHLLLLLLAAVTDACLIKKICSNAKQCKDLIDKNADCSIDWKEAAW